MGAPSLNPRLGTPFQRKDAKALWVVKVRTEDRDARDRIVYKAFKGRTAEIATEKAQEFADLLDRNRGRVVSSNSLSSYMADWLANDADVDPSTEATYRSYIKTKVDAAPISSVPLSKLDVDHIRDWKRWLRQFEPRTAVQAMAIVQKALNDAVAYNKLVHNPLRDVPKPTVPKRKTPRLNLDQVTTFLATVKDSRLESRWAFAFLTGSRQGESLGLELERVDLSRGKLDLAWQLQRIAFDHGCAEEPRGRDSKGRDQWACGRVKAGYCPDRKRTFRTGFDYRHLDGGLYLIRPKTVASERVIPLVPPLTEHVERRVEAASREPNPHGLLWTSETKQVRATRAELPLDGSPIDPARDNKTWHAILDSAGLPNVKLHSARHSAITLLSATGVPREIIADIVGHGETLVTEIYREQQLEPQREALLKLGALLAGGQAN